MTASYALSDQTRQLTCELCGVPRRHDPSRWLSGVPNTHTMINHDVGLASRSIRGRDLFVVVNDSSLASGPILASDVVEELPVSIVVIDEAAQREHAINPPSAGVV